MLAACFVAVLVQLLSYVWLFVTRGLQHTRLLCPPLSPWDCSNSCSLSWWCSLTISSSATPFSFCHQSFPASGFSSESALCIRWPKYWSFSFNISPSNEYSGLISFRIDWFDFVAVQGTHKGLLQHHTLEAPVLRHSYFFMVQLSHPYSTTGKTIVLTIWTFVGKVISLVFNTLSAAAKSPQSCRTLCDPRDDSPPGSPVPGILQARTLEWVAISFSKAWKWKVKVKSLSRVRLLATPWTAAHQAPPSMGFSRQEYWSGVPLPSPPHTIPFSKSYLFHSFQTDKGCPLLPPPLQPPLHVGSKPKSPVLLQ